MIRATICALWYTTISVVLLVISGCTMEGTVEPGQTIACTDTRDGEVFMFDSSTVRDVRVGVLGAETCLTLTDHNKSDRRICTNEERFLKCKEASK